MTERMYVFANVLLASSFKQYVEEYQNLTPKMQKIILLGILLGRNK